MSRLSKPAAKAHAAAVERLTKVTLDIDDKLFVIEHWQESANNVNTVSGAFFTPWGLASDMAIEVGSVNSVIDLCAGIGTLSLAVWQHHLWSESKPRMVCVERNEAYVEVGRKLLPEAEWVVGNVLGLPDLGRFDVAISNPPFGAIGRVGNGPRYTGKDFELHTIDVASTIADRGVFIVPQGSTPFEYSGKDYYQVRPSEKYDRFNAATGLTLDAGCGIDTSYYADCWHLVSPVVEVALSEFPPTVERAPAHIPLVDDVLFDLIQVGDS